MASTACIVLVSTAAGGSVRWSVFLFLHVLNTYHICCLYAVYFVAVKTHEARVDMGAVRWKQRRVRQVTLAFVWLVG